MKSKSKKESSESSGKNNEEGKIMIRDWDGKVGEFDRKRFVKWLVKNVEISDGRARRVVHSLEHELKGQKFIDAKELIIRGSRLAIQLPWSLKEMRQLSFFNNPLQGFGKTLLGSTMNVDPGQIIQGLGMVPDIVSLISGLLGGGWEVDRPGKVKKEFGGGLAFGDDGTAPEITNVSVNAVGCCTPKLGGKGLSVSIEVEVTDDRGSLGNDSGVQMVEITGVEMNGGTVVGLSPVDGGKWELSEDENDKTQKGKVKHTFNLCVSCGLVSEGKIRLIIRVVDADDNQQVMYYVIPVAHKAKECCS